MTRSLAHERKRKGVTKRRGEMGAILILVAKGWHVGRKKKTKTIRRSPPWYIKHKKPTGNSLKILNKRGGEKGIALQATC